MADTFDIAALREKVVLVTGGSRGIGAGMVAGFARCGARCVINYVDDPAGRNRADAQQVAAAADDAGASGASTILQCDVASDQQVLAMMEQIRTQFGGLDVLVNNAGIIRDRTLKKMTSDDWNAVLQVNLTGAFNCLHHAAPLLRAGGSIVNVSSVSGVLGLFGQANYASSKAGLIALTKVAAREFARQQVTVNAVAPGFVDTEMSRTMPEEVTRRFLEQVPLARFGQVEDIVNAVLFLCSPFARYITGQVIHVNGGFHMP